MNIIELYNLILCNDCGSFFLLWEDKDMASGVACVFWLVLSAVRIKKANLYIAILYR